MSITKDSKSTEYVCNVCERCKDFGLNSLRKWKPWLQTKIFPFESTFRRFPYVVSITKPLKVEKKRKRHKLRVIKDTLIFISGLKLAIIPIIGLSAHYCINLSFDVRNARNSEVCLLQFPKPQVMSSNWKCLSIT